MTIINDVCTLLIGGIVADALTQMVELKHVTRWPGKRHTGARSLLGRREYLSVVLKSETV